MLLLLSPAYQGPFVQPDKRAPAGAGPILRSAFGQRPENIGGIRLAATSGARPIASTTRRPTAAGGRRPTH